MIVDIVGAKQGSSASPAFDPYGKKDQSQNQNNLNKSQNRAKQVRRLLRPYGKTCWKYC
jgi:hypothetical protein